MNISQTLHRSLTRAARRTAPAVLAVAVVLISGWSCKSPTGPSGGEADIIITSHWDVPVDISMDGAFRFTLGYKETAEIDNVSRKTHLLEAKSQLTGEVVAQKSLEVTDKTDYTWTIEHRARINLTNSLGESVKIFMDGIFQFDLADDEDRWIIDVPLGQHLLAAFKASDEKEVAATTVKVTENKDYSWTIKTLGGTSSVAITEF